MTVTPPEVPAYGGCPWPLDPACLNDQWTALSPDVQARAAALASSTLQRLTGYRVSNCPVTVRPSMMNTGICFVPDYGHGTFFPGMNIAGAWVNNCGTCQHDNDPNDVPLPAPVGRVDEVQVSGVVIDPTLYRVDGHVLVWQGGGAAPWRGVQDFSVPNRAVGSFSVTYLNAYPVDSLGAYAAGVLAMEFAKACAGNKCRLPAGVTTIARQGVTMEIAHGSFPGGLTGIREVDAFIGLWNPGALRQQTGVWTPDMHSPRVVR